MSDIRCSREGIKCEGCPIMDKCEYIECTEEIDPYVLYEQGRADKEKELQGIKDLGSLYSEIRADERAKVIEEVEKLKNQVPVNRLLDNIIEDKPKELGMLIAYDEVLKVLEEQ